MISAQEAYRIGLVNEIVPAADLITRAEAILKKIASNAPIAVKFALEAANKGLETSQAKACCWRLPTSGSAPPPRTRRKARRPSWKSARPSSKGDEIRSSRTIWRDDQWQVTTSFPGSKVVDFASFIAGPSAAVILSDFGADVIKVEPPTGDLWRRRAQDPAAAASEGGLSLAPGQPQQARHDARSEIAERPAGSREARQMGRRAHRQHPASRAQAIEARI